ncbi:sensor histidine kinase [Pseudonocardia sp. CA-107938]|uniref:sensor histidine kinase n=1 Tax=Pseudonocardia sp. CA-107938 TaxID=3240021 RepID=UPI003D923839
MAYEVPLRTAAPVAQRSTSLSMWSWAGLWVLVLAAEAAALAPVIAGAEVPPIGVVYRLVGGSFAACGLVAWRRRPDSRSGPLMLLTGAAFLLGPLIGLIQHPVADLIRNWFADLWFLFFLPLLLTLRTGGRLRHRADRVLVAVVAVEVFVLAPAYLVVAESDPPTAAVVDAAQRILFAGVSLATAVVLAVRYRRATRPGRRALLPSLAGVACLLLYVALLVIDLLLGSSRSSPLAVAVSWVAAISIVTVPLAFLAELLRSRLARGELAGLLQELRSAGPAQLQGALSRALGDPLLTIAHRRDDGTFLDAHGAAVPLPPPDDDRSALLLERAGEPVAALIHDRALDDDPDLVAAVGAAATIALENRHLQSEVEAKLAELQASRERIISAADAERRRIERNLHDGAQQRLVTLALQLSLIRRSIRAHPADAEELVAAAGDELARSLEELRELARGIHPAALEHGLDVALDALAMRAAVPTEVAADPGPRLPEPIEFAIYLVASEALTNVARYAAASSATVTLRREPARATVEIADDGCGGADPALGTGLRGLADRVEALGGQLRITSPKGAGTVVTAAFPLHQQA